MRLALVSFCAAALLSAQSKGTLLESLTWVEAERALTDQAVIVIPLGAESKEHGPHLLLKNDFVMAEYLKKRVLNQANVVVAPTINTNFYPAFLEYPGSISLELDTARDLVAEVCRTLSRYGPKRFYVLNTGVSTMSALRPAAEVLAAQGILMRYTNLLTITKEIERAIVKEEGGTHAEEVETSMMLYIAPETVNMKKALKDYHADAPGGLTRKPDGAGTYSASGVWGDATLATREKGEKLVEALVSGVLREIEAIRQAPLPRRTLDTLDLSRYTGEYRTASGQALRIGAADGQLFMQRSGGRRMALAPISEWRFTTGATPVNFSRDERDLITGFTLWLNGQETRAVRSKN